MEATPYQQLFDLKEKFINENYANLKSTALAKKIEEVQRIITEFKTSKQMLESMVQQCYNNRNAEPMVYTEDDMFIDFFGSKIRDISKDLMIGMGNARMGTPEEAQLYQKKISEYNAAIDKYDGDLNLIKKAIEDMHAVLADLQDKFNIIQSEEKLFGDLSFTSDSERAIAMANARVIARTFEPVLSRLTNLENRVRDLDDCSRSIIKHLNNIQSELEIIKKNTKQD
jgi:prefoldin subunit 5